jgi:hypothetical protein
VNFNLNPENAAIVALLFPIPNQSTGLEKEPRE